MVRQCVQGIYQYGHLVQLFPMSKVAKIKWTGWYNEPTATTEVKINDLESEECLYCGAAFSNWHEGAVCTMGCKPK